MNHTPGPWRAYQFEDQDHTDIVGANDTIVCHMVHKTVSGVTKLDETLIAAAPDLLEALTRIIESRHLPNLIAIINEAFPLILKAQGETSKERQNYDRINNCQRFLHDHSGLFDHHRNTRFTSIPSAG